MRRLELIAYGNDRLSLKTRGAFLYDAVLAQVQSDGKLHPIVYASRSLSPPEKNYIVTKLETLTVVWAMSHFHYYLYGHKVKVYTDHTAVKEVLDTPNPTRKHARWCSLHVRTVSAF